EQQNCGSVPGTSGGDRNQGNEEERRVRHSWPGTVGKVKPESPHGTESPDRRTHQNRGQDRSKVPRRQSSKRHHRAQEITSAQQKQNFTGQPRRLAFSFYVCRCAPHRLRVALGMGCCALVARSSPVFTLRSKPPTSSAWHRSAMRLGRAARRASRARC